MRYAPFLLMAFWFPAMAALGQGPANPAPRLADTASGRQTDSELIQQIESDWLKAERNTDPIVVERVLADDYVNLVPTGTGPGKATLLKNFREHAGETPPYSVQQEDMHVYLLGDTAVAAYLKIYIAKENKNVAREDTTHIFTKDGGIWKLRISRTSTHQGE